MIGTIVVGYDGGEAAERALLRAAEIAERFAARLVVLVVGRSTRTTAPELVPEEVVAPIPAGPTTVPFPPMVEPPSTPGELEEPARRTLERARAVLGPRNIEADYLSMVGDPAELLLQAADHHEADLIVVGSREHGFLERLLGIAVDEEVVRKAHRDVLLVR